MKIAIPTEGNQVFGHFGQCKTFTLYTIENNTVTRQEIIESPGHTGGLLPEFLSKQGVTHVISGGMGPKAIDNFNSYGIEVYLGISGSLDDVIQSFCKGELVSSGSACKDHQH